MKKVSILSLTALASFSMAQAVTLLSYDFATGLDGLASSVSPYGFASIEIPTGGHWSLGTGNLTAIGDDIGTGVTTDENGFFITYTISGLGAGESIDLTNITYDYTGFASSTRVGAGAPGNPISINPADGDGSFDYATEAPAQSPAVAVNLGTGLTNGDTVIIELGFRDGPNANGLTYTVDNLVIEGDVNTIPEPSSTALLGLAGMALILRRRR